MENQNGDPNSGESALVEGEDYYIEEGLYIFTETYLKKRGTCCYMFCRHCPYLCQVSDKKNYKSNKIF